MLILGIETSCDETAVALVEDGRVLHSNVIASQVELHARFGGVVPELASRQHVLALEPALRRALDQAGAAMGDVDLVAVTHEPGLIGALLPGVAFAKGLALAGRVPLLGVHHLEGHVYANWLVDPRAAGPAVEPPAFPIVCLIVSGGHSEIVLMREHGDFERLGTTRDDAAGEAFDKVARLLGLGFPGGPEIERAARRGDPRSVEVPRAWLGDSYDFSFSGMKTAVQRIVGRYDPGELRGPDGAPSQLACDIAAAFQEAMNELMTTKTLQAAERAGARTVLLSGGVAANRALVARFEAEATLPVAAPVPRLCTDNAAMIAACAYYRHLAGARSDFSLDVRAVSRIG